MNTIRFYHYSPTPFSFDATHSYDQEAHGNFKPDGLWLSAEHDGEESYGWADWCRANDWNTVGLACRVEVALKEDANVLVLTSAADIDRFTHSFRRSLVELSSYRSIDWRKVVACYDGIVIAPYVWERRLSEHANWYYTWDCASACIWNLRAVEAVVPCEQLSIAAEDVSS